MINNITLALAGVAVGLESQFPVRAHTKVAGSIPGWGIQEVTDLFLSNIDLSLSPSLLM